MKEKLKNRRLNRAKEIRDRKKKIKLDQTLYQLKKLRRCAHPLPRVIIRMRGKMGDGMYNVEVCTHCGKGKPKRRIDQK